MFMLFTDPDANTVKYQRKCEKIGVLMRIFSSYPKLALVFDFVYFYKQNFVCYSEFAAHTK